MVRDRIALARADRRAPRQGHPLSLGGGERGLPHPARRERRRPVYERLGPVGREPRLGRRPEGQALPEQPGRRRRRHARGRAREHGAAEPLLELRHRDRALRAQQQQPPLRPPDRPRARRHDGDRKRPHRPLRRDVERHATRRRHRRARDLGESRADRRRRRFDSQANRLQGSRPGRVPAHPSGFLRPGHLLGRLSDRTVRPRCLCRERQRGRHVEPLVRPWAGRCRRGRRRGGPGSAGETRPHARVTTRAADPGRRRDRHQGPDRGGLERQRRGDTGRRRHRAPVDRRPARHAARSGWARRRPAQPQRLEPGRHQARLRHDRSPRARVLHRPPGARRLDAPRAGSRQAGHRHVARLEPRSRRLERGDHYPWPTRPERRSRTTTRPV